MPNPDMWWPQVQDPARALGLLTRLPVPVDGDAAQARGAASAWAYPLVGIVVGAITGGSLWLACWVGLPGVAAAALALAVSLFVTGALHEDGLADTVDGLWGGWTTERRLEIMKDSRIGAYGVLALGLMLITKVALLSEGPPVLLLIATAMGSRAAMVVLMSALPHARSGGLSHAVGKPPIAAMWVALALGALAVGLASLTAVLVGACVAFGIAWIARTKIEGQTGDILGATQVVVELAVLGTLVAQMA